MAGDGDYGGDFGDTEALTDEFGGYEAGRSGDDELHRLKIFLSVTAFHGRKGGKCVMEQMIICVLFSCTDGILVRLSFYMRSRT